MYYWIDAGTHYNEVAQLNRDVIEKTPKELIKRTSLYWAAWITKESRSYGDLPKSVIGLYNRSLLILRTQINGGLTRQLYHNRLKRYSRSGHRKGKGYELDQEIDVSLSGLTNLGVLPSGDPRVVETMEAIQKQLWLETRVGGCAGF